MEEKDVWWQIYFIELFHKATGKITNKIGITSTGVTERFSAANDPRWDLFTITLLDHFEIYGKRADAEKWEKYLHSRFPKNIWLEKYIDDGTDWDGLGGITEMVVFHHGIEQDVEFGAVKVSNIKEVYSEFTKLRAMVEEEKPSPEPKEYFRATRANSLTFEQVLACSLLH